MAEAREATISLRWVIPFLRASGADPQRIRGLAREGIAPGDLANSERRIRHGASMELLERALRDSADPCLGLRAAERLEAGDFAVLGEAARSCATLRQAIDCANRFMPLWHGAQHGELIEDRERAIWQLRMSDEVRPLAAASDFILAAAWWFMRGACGRSDLLREVHFRHPVATSVAAYGRTFAGAEVKLAMRHNALVFASDALGAPLTCAHSGLQAAFEQQASALLQRLKRTEGVAGRVRELLLEQLRAGDVSMSTIARRMAMSVATLRRRLDDEETSHSAILDEVRRELSEEYLGYMTIAISEVAFLLGFSHVTAYYKAFRRWTKGMTPAEFRAQLQRR